VIEVRQLWKSFGGRPVLRGVSLAIAAGERVALVGPNGSGKSTLLRCLLGVLAADGALSIDGFDPFREHVHAQTKVAYVPQRAPALAVSVGDLVAFWAGMRHEQPAALHDAAAMLGLDLHDVRTRRFVELSGGMQQKLLAAMALASRCPVLLLDEPTANLDPPARRSFFDALLAREPRPTVLLSSHRLEDLRALVDRVVVLEEGRVAFDDRLDRLLDDPNVIRRLGIEHVSTSNVLTFRRPP
jgi:ABC-2 type transport system ATP-binding protein